MVATQYISIAVAHSISTVVAQYNSIAGPILLCQQQLHPLLNETANTATVLQRADQRI